MRLQSDRWEILLVALILAAAHVVSPWVFERRRDPSRQHAFSGGLSIGYVFLHLIPSLDDSHELVGGRIYFIALLGFVVFYGLDALFQPPRHRHPTKYHAYLGAFFLYDGLLVFTLGLVLPPRPLLTVAFAIALALDVLSTDLELQETYGARFVRSGRWVLLGGVMTGYVLSLLRRPRPLMVDILTAALAGIMMFHIFSGELPVRTKRFGAFCAGLALFCFSHLSIGSSE
jgi:hypothetical protein